MDYKDLRTILIVSTYQDPKVIVGEFNIKNSDCEKLLLVKIDNKLTFGCDVSETCKSSSRYINALATVIVMISANLFILAAEMHKVRRDLTPALMLNVFKLRSEQKFSLKTLKQLVWRLSLR